MLDHPQLKSIASRHGATPAQIALAWLLHQRVVVIPKASKPQHVRENRAALDITLTREDLGNSTGPSRLQTVKRLLKSSDTATLAAGQQTGVLRPFASAQEIRLGGGGSRNIQFAARLSF